jgi:hypothetical protein
LDKDKQIILGFVNDLYEWLEISFLHKRSEHKWPVIYVIEELREDAKAAWLQFQEDYPKKAFTRSVSHFSKKRLTSHGLYGAQLKYKLHTVEIAANNVKSKQQGWKKKLLDVLDNLLESIGDSLPGYGALKELKDSLLIGVDE